MQKNIVISLIIITNMKTTLKQKKDDTMHQSFQYVSKKWKTKKHQGTMNSIVQ